MCGVFGVITNNKEINQDSSLFINSLKFLGKASQSRGKDSSGVCIYNEIANEIDILKGPLPVASLFKSSSVIKNLTNGFKNNAQLSYAFGHARLVTNGSQLNISNNQPVVKNNIIGIHNGIVVNVEELWSKYESISREFEIDTEVLFALIHENIKTKNLSIESAVSKTMSEINGTAATAFIEQSMNRFILATNNGSLYTIKKENQFVIFASEQFILEKLLQKFQFKKMPGNYVIEPINPLHGLSIDLTDLTFTSFYFNDQFEEKIQSKKSTPAKIKLKEINPKEIQLSAVLDLNYIHLNPEAEKEKQLLKYPLDEIKKLKRCAKCILPETFPFIDFDDNDICCYCTNYKKQTQSNSLDDLMSLVEPYRMTNGSRDVLLPFSGGRDSTYALHLAKNELGLNPITFTYDWGMVTDLARRNIARICGKLGVENIIVAANIKWKRRNIKQNILAWLKNPELGMIPLFMAGDKYFFYYAHKIKKQLGINLELWGVNRLENTDFKTGFSGLKPNFNKKRIYSISFLNQLKLLGFVAKNVIKSPSYLNQSIFDSFGSIGSRYLMPKKDYYHLFDYIPWNENIINETIIDNYGWEKAVDTDSTWRIGDGTASFYNYIYTLIAGFSENDTFRSNQIREGMITREKALSLVYEENMPRYNSLKWYLEIIGLDYEYTIKKINKINGFSNE